MVEDVHRVGTRSDHINEITIKLKMLSTINYKDIVSNWIGMNSKFILEFDLKIIR